jgi:sulfate adenylyltransferase subunit 1 (EFTu-like GTPase family)
VFSFRDEFSQWDPKNQRPELWNLYNTRLPHLVLAVNKMDLVDYDSAVFERIAEEFTAFAAKLEIGDLTFIPISALHGDPHQVTRSGR